MLTVRPWQRSGQDQADQDRPGDGDDLLQALGDAKQRHDRLRTTTEPTTIRKPRMNLSLISTRIDPLLLHVIES